MDKEKVKFVTIRGKRIPIKDKKMWRNKKSVERGWEKIGKASRKIRGLIWRKTREVTNKMQWPVWLKIQKVSQDVQRPIWKRIGKADKKVQGLIKNVLRKASWWTRKPEEGTLARKIQDFGNAQGPTWKKIRERSKKAGLTGLKAPSWWRKKKK